MRTKTGRMADTRQVNLVFKDQVEHILWDGNKIKGVMDQMARGLNKEQIIRFVGQRVYERAFNLKAAMDSGNAFLLKRSAMEMGFVFPVGQEMELTPEGEGELMLIAARDLDSNLKIIAAGGKQLKSFEPIARRLFLGNKTLWVAKYKHKMKNPDEGSLIFGTYMTGMKKGPVEGINNVINHLLSRLKARYYDAMEEDIEETLRHMQELFPATDSNSELALQMFGVLQQQIEDAQSIEEPEDNIERSVVEDEESDEKLERMMAESIGPYIVTGDPRGRLVAHVLELQLLRDEIKAGEYNASPTITKNGLMTFIGEDHLYEDHIRPIVDFYTGKELLGNDINYVTVNLTEVEKADEREDFPYDANIDAVSIKRYMKEPRYIDYVKDTVVHSYESVKNIKPNDMFGAEFFKPVLGVMEHTKLKKAGERSIVQVIQRFNDYGGYLNLHDEFNMELEADFQLNKIYEKAEFWKEWRKNTVLTALADSKKKQHLDAVGTEQYCLDMLEVHIQSLLDNSELEYKQIKNKVMYYYNWEAGVPTFGNRAHVYA